MSNKCIFAMDCEMVESCGTSILARVTFVNQHGVVIMDEYVKPTEPVTNYRTPISGIRPMDLENGQQLTIVRRIANNLLHRNIIIGHSLKHDLAALNLSHPHKDRRDLAIYPPLLLDGEPQSLKNLALKYLGRNIQTGEHNSREDAKACMDIYLMFAEQWERDLE